MTRDEVLAVVQRRQAAFNGRDMDAYREVYADDARVDSPFSGAVRGPDAIVRSAEAFFAAFPDAVIAAQPPIIDGNRAVIVADFSGTHVGPILGLSPTGRPFRFRSAVVCTIQDGRIVEETRIYDFTGLLVQIGVLKAKPV